MKTKNINAAALVTGSTDGIGLAVAKKLVKSGYSVLINGRNEDKMLAAINQLKSLKNTHQWIDGVLTDITKPKALNKIVDLLKKYNTPLKAAFINTATPKVSLPEELNENDWEYALRALVRFPDKFIREIAKIMSEYGGGSIVLNSSCSATIPIGPEFYLANTLRSVSVAQAKAFARQYVSKGIRINIILTGYVDTNLTRRLAKQISKKINKNEDKLWKTWEDSIPIGRLAVPEEIAEVAAFLLSYSSSYMIGAVIDVDGGISMMHHNF